MSEVLLYGTYDSQGQVEAFVFKRFTGCSLCARKRGVRVHAQRPQGDKLTGKRVVNCTQQTVGLGNGPTQERERQRDTLLQKAPIGSEEFAGILPEKEDECLECTKWDLGGDVS